jgi:hypothetical protein
MRKKEDYRVREFLGTFSIEVKCGEKAWKECDVYGYPIINYHQKLASSFEDLESAKKRIKEFLRGNIYHYLEEDEVEKYFYKKNEDCACLEKCNVRKNGIYIGSTSCKQCDFCLDSDKVEFKWIKCSKIEEATGNN